MTSPDCAHLRHLVTAYFHEDWRLDAASVVDVVRQYVAREPAENVAAVRHELSQLPASGSSEADLRRLVLDQWQSSYDPVLAGGTARAWLEEIRSVA